MSVQVASMIAHKPVDGVVTVTPEQSVTEVLAVLREHNIGVVVVSSDGNASEGILSERDVVRRLADIGPEALDLPVREVMTTTVTTCTPDQTAEQLMGLMTSGRIRHVPVVEDGRMIGLISIGDVVKSYVDDLERTAESLAEYVAGNTY